MAREYYRCLFKLHNTERLLLWYSNDCDGVFLSSAGVVPTFSSVEALDSYADAASLPLKVELPTLHDLDSVQEFAAGRGELDCNQILAAWNLFADVARSTGEIGAAFKESDQPLNAIYDKILYGSNLPSITPEGQAFTPSWSPKELEAIRELMKIGFTLFNRVTDPPKNKQAEQGGGGKGEERR